MPHSINNQCSIGPPRTKMNKYLIFMSLCFILSIQSADSKTEILTNVEGKIAIIEEEAVNTLKKLKDEISYSWTSRECDCKHFRCYCCAGVDIEVIGLNATMCFEAIYLTEELGLELKVEINNYTLIDKKVSVKNPPPVCFGEPYTFDLAEACLYIYDISASKLDFHSCIRIEGHVKHIPVVTKRLGCFDIKGLAKGSENQDLKGITMPGISNFELCHTPTSEAKSLSITYWSLLLGLLLLTLVSFC